MSAAPARQPPVWTAPLVPVALALSAGVVLDRFLVVPLPVSAVAFIGCLLGWGLFVSGRKPGLALAYLWLGVTAVGAAYHHGHRHHLDAADISRRADHEPTPARVRGVLQSAPRVQAGQRDDPLHSLPTRDTTRFTLRVTQHQNISRRTWTTVTGQAQVTVVGRVGNITVGDEVELLGRLALPTEPMNPGEFDYAGYLRDQGVTVTIAVVDAGEVTLLRQGWPSSLFGWLAVARAAAQRILAHHLAPQEALGSALLLGEGSGMTGDAWEQYLRTGVIHVLAISGQHLVVLAGFLWLLVRVLGLRRRRAAPLVVLLLVGYALLTGGRPPVMRAAWTVAAYGGATLLQRPISHANTFALAWIGVLLVNPTDLFNAGCQLSFLAVAVLMGGVSRWTQTPVDPLQQAIDESRAWPVALAMWLGRKLASLWLLNAVVWLAVAPLVAWHYHLVSPIALLIGPPLVLLTSTALLSGFALLLFAEGGGPLVSIFAWATRASLAGCDGLVTLGQQVPGAYFFVADVPAWWVWTFNAAILLALSLAPESRLRRGLLLGGAGWLVMGFAAQLLPHRPGEFRCTFVAVGHGGCTVLETPPGRVIVYDAGATTGPDVTRRHIAPFLWSRGIRRIDDLILSHADLDHFNGVVALADRFAIGRVVVTPLFARRESAGLKQTLAVLEKRGITIDRVHAGQGWRTDGVDFDVLHPPEVFTSDKENARSLVLRVRSEAWVLLLTGDLEDEGLERLLQQPRSHVDLLMAPHHGSDRANLPALAAWARPRLVVSCQAAPLNERASVKMYEKLGIPFWGTWPHGMITVRQRDGRTWAETYRTRQQHEF